MPTLDSRGGQADTAYSAQDDTLAATINGIRTALAQVVDKSLQLLALESRLAALSLSTMLFLAVIVALLFFSAWLFILAASAVWLIGLGLTWESALIAGACVNVLLTFPAMYLIRRLSRQLTFTACRRQLKRGLEPSHVHSDSA